MKTPDELLQEEQIVSNKKIEDITQTIDKIANEAINNKKIRPGGGEVIFKSPNYDNNDYLDGFTINVIENYFDKHGWDAKYSPKNPEDKSSDCFDSDYFEHYFTITPKPRPR